MAKREDGLRIEYMRLGDIRKWPRNPKDHDLGALHQSYDRFGFVSPMVLNEATGELLAGHGRLDALAQKKADGGPPPGRVRVDGDGEWLVPVVRGISLEGHEGEAYSLADNRLVELGGWEEAKLARLLSELEGEGLLAATGFSGTDLAAMAMNLAGPAEWPAYSEGMAETGGEREAHVECPNCGHRFVPA